MGSILVPKPESNKRRHVSEASVCPPVMVVCLGGGGLGQTESLDTYHFFADPGIDSGFEFRVGSREGVGAGGFGYMSPFV